MSLKLVSSELNVRQCLAEEMDWPWREEARGPMYQAALSALSHLLTGDFLCTKSGMVMPWGWVPQILALSTRPYSSSSGPRSVYDLKDSLNILYLNSLIYLLSPKVKQLLQDAYIKLCISASCQNLLLQNYLNNGTFTLHEWKALYMSKMEGSYRVWEWL